MLKFLLEKNFYDYRFGIITEKQYWINVGYLFNEFGCVAGCDLFSQMSDIEKNFWKKYK